MKKLAILLTAILVLTGCQANDTSSEGLVISQANDARMEARMIQENTNDERWSELNEKGWYVYDVEK